MLDLAIVTINRSRSAKLKRHKVQEYTTIFKSCPKTCVPTYTGIQQARGSCQLLTKARGRTENQKEVGSLGADTGGEKAAAKGRASSENVSHLPGSSEMVVLGFGGGALGGDGARAEDPAQNLVRVHRRPFTGNSRRTGQASGRLIRIAGLPRDTRPYDPSLPASGLTPARPLPLPPPLPRPTSTGLIDRRRPSRRSRAHASASADVAMSLSHTRRSTHYRQLLIIDKEPRGEGGRGGGERAGAQRAAGLHAARRRRGYQLMHQPIVRAIGADRVSKGGRGGYSIAVKLVNKESKGFLEGERVKWRQEGLVTVERSLTVVDDFSARKSPAYNYVRGVWENCKTVQDLSIQSVLPAHERYVINYQAPCT